MHGISAYLEAVAVNPFDELDALVAWRHTLRLQLQDQLSCTARDGLVMSYGEERVDISIASINARIRELMAEVERRV